METAEIKAYHEIYRKELFDYVVPFWLGHSPDREYGGYLTLLERDGTVFDTDKYAWMQGREIWMFSKLCSVYGTRNGWKPPAWALRSCARMAGPKTATSTLPWTGEAMR